MQAPEAPRTPSSSTTSEPVEPTLGVNVDPNDAATQELVSKYAKAEAEVAVALQSAVPVLPDGTATQNRNVNRQFRRSQQRNTEAFLDRIRGQLDDDTAEWVRRVIPHTYISGASKVALATDSDTQVSWNLLHRQAATLLAADTQADLAAATAHMTEGAKDFIRYAAKREVLDQVLTGRAATIGRQLAKRLEQQGLSGFVDASGRSWRLSTYAEMVVRTKRQAAQNTGASIRMQQQGVTACYIIDGTRDDEDCRTINGRTCSVAWSLNHPLEHPNCTRTFGPLPNYDGPLDYGTYDDTIDLDKLGKEPDEQLLYGDPPTQRPARNPVRAGQLPKPEPSLPPAPPVEVVDVIGAATVAEYRAVANQLGFDEDPLEWVPDNDLVKMANAWDDLDDNAKRLAIRQEMQKLGLTPKAVVGEVTEDALAAAKSAAPQWAQDAVQTFQGKGYNLTADQVVDLLDDSPLSSTLSLVQQQLATGGPAADVFESFLQSKGVAKVVADIDIPGGGPAT